MKIEKSKLKTIIAEEVRNILLNEDWKDTLRGVGSAVGGAAMSVGKEFAKGFMGKGDQWFTKGFYRAYGRTRVSKIDEIFDDLLQEFREFKNHPEAAHVKLTDDPTLDGVQVVSNIEKKLQEDIIKLWVDATMLFRGPDAEKRIPATATPAPTPAPAPMPEGLTVPFDEVLRREVREELKKRTTS
jgi:hypothetical protein